MARLWKLPHVSRQCRRTGIVSQRQVYRISWTEKVRHSQRDYRRNRHSPSHAHATETFVVLNAHLLTLGNTATSGSAGTRGYSDNGTAPWGRVIARMDPMRATRVYPIV